MNTSRRQFLRASSALAAAAGTEFSAPFATSLAALGALAAQSSQAADTSGYKALVCLFLAGGNDSHNWVVPMDADNYATYASARGPLTWSSGKLTPITCASQGSGRSFGMPQDLAPLRDWYENGRAAVIANVGSLVRPITKADYQNSTNLPAKLFSHNDQASEWQSLSPEGANSGWGGRMGDILMSANENPVFTAVSATGNAVFLTGSKVTQYQVGLDGPVVIRGLVPNGWKFGSAKTGPDLGKALAAPGNNAFEAEYGRVVQRSIATTGTLTTALQGVNIPAIPTTTFSLGNGSSSSLDKENLAKQFRAVAQMIAAGQALGLRRQVFMVSIPGFDTHSNQMTQQPASMARVSQCANYFLNTLNSMGMLNNVTLFTASDFGRTLTANMSGSDHGWGSHHFVAGGAVNGKNIYGTFPVTALGADTDIGSGRLLPTTSVAEYAAGMGRWMGLTSSELATVLPTLGNFPASSKLGFL